MKKITLLVLSLLLAFSLLACQNQSDDNPETTAPETENETPEANPASDFEYRFTEKQTALITKYIGNSKNVVIPAEIEGRKVTSLFGTEVNLFMQGVFQDSDIETVFIPATLQKISVRSFKNCTALTSITIQNNSELHTISGEAFENCSSLSKINLPNSITEIGLRAFYGCSSLVEIDLPNELTELGKYSISNCPSLKKIVIPTKIESMRSGMTGDVPICNNLSLEQIIFEDGIEEIRGYGFILTTSDV